jgi:hypothetical protein
MTDKPNRYASRERPAPVRTRDADRIDAEGDHIFRFAFDSVVPPRDLSDDELFRWVIEEQLKAILGIVEFGTSEGSFLPTHYRFKNETDFRTIDL